MSDVSTSDASRKREFGSWLAALRESSLAGTQAQASARIGISRVQLARWETGAALPGAKNYQAIADAYHIRVNEIQERIGMTQQSDAVSDWSQSLARRLQRQTANFSASQRAAIEHAIDSIVAVAAQR